MYIHTEFSMEFQELLVILKLGRRSMVANCAEFCQHYGFAFRQWPCFNIAFLLKHFNQLWRKTYQITTPHIQFKVTK
jgi:hypothetical protein